jgi:tetratricopeptide (TPR) repeat protein
LIKEKVMKSANFIKSLFLVTLFITAVSFVIVPVGRTVSAAEGIGAARYIDSGDEKFDRLFREGRDLIDKEEWAKAAAKFNEIVCDCPDKKYVDAAFYWLAFCYKKQKMYQETNQTIDRLLKNFPESSWADDARVMRIQVYTLTEKPRSATVVSGQGISKIAPPAIAYVPGQSTLTTEMVYSGVATLSPSVQLDREDEIKLAAFQSLFAADPKKAIEAMGNILRADSKASETLKREVLRSLRGSRFFGKAGFGETFYAQGLTPTTVVTQLNPVLRETLVKGFQNEPNTKIRAEIIYSIANINDDQSYNYLFQLYPTETNKELKKAIINSFGNSVYTFGTPLTEASLIRKGEVERVVAATNQNVSPIRKLRFDKLMEIFRVEKDLELRRLAFTNVQRFAGWADREGFVDTLGQMYDAETDEQFKVLIINSFSNIKNKQATTKLLDIARNEKSDKLRLEAIRALRNNNSPEVIKFLEELIN